MPDSEFDHQLIKALSIYCNDLLGGIPKEEALQQGQIFSAEFEHKMRKLIQRAAQSPQKISKQLAQRIALIILVFTFGFASLMSVEAIRIPVLRFLTEIHETFTRIIFQDEGTTAPPAEIEQVYTPGFIPEGFLLDYELHDTNFMVLSYTNSEDFFEWSQYTLDFAHHVNTEGTTLDTLEKNGRTYLYYSQQGNQTLVWEEGGYSFLCSGTLPKELLLQIADSAKK